MSGYIKGYTTYWLPASKDKSYKVRKEEVQMRYVTTTKTRTIWTGHPLDSERQNYNLEVLHCDGQRETGVE